MTTSRARSLFLFSSLMVMGPAIAQDAPDVVRAWLQERHAALGLTAQDATDWTVTDRSTDRKGVSYVYIRQQVQGLPVFGAVANFAVRGGQVVHFGNRLEARLAQRCPAPVPALGAAEALRRAAGQLGLSTSRVRVERTISPTVLELSPSGISHDPIPAILLYQPLRDGNVRLAWDLTIRSLSTPNWWHIAVDARTGEIIRTTDHIVSCTHPAPGQRQAYNTLDDLMLPAPALALPPDGSGYRVFPFPTESPSHGDHVLVNEPADPVASPFGWHDVDGFPGAEYTITRGNNVFAYEDMDDDDLPGYSPDGGPALSFDFPYTPPQVPLDYLDASITNLFHACNVLHDVLYRYGFDEQSGNFQVNNYGHGGEENDEVIAQAQDGGGMNNANFGTPPDGGSGRMQMYLWRTSADSMLYINAPEAIAGVYTSAAAGFGPPLPAEPLTADVVLVVDNAAPVNNGCETIINASAIAGKIALVDRGQCTFISKVEALQAVGAVAVIVVNNVPGGPISMGGSGGEGITIPSVMVSLEDGAVIKDALLGGPVNATLVGLDMEDLRDSGFDNGIVAHEYGHGVSNRLTGGGNNVDCLWNAEQMGEGWSDYIGIALTMRTGDQATAPRGVGTFVRDQEPDGVGIRPAPYTTDTGVNPYTYGDTNDDALSQPHGVGFVWATMLWDMTWALVDEYGFDADLHTGTGGNNLAFQLVMDGMKLQPCNPGFVDGRDAILMADELLTGGANECLIWNVFAQRGLGASASQGSSDNRFDQVEAFDLPAQCLSTAVGERAADAGFRLMPNPATTEVTLGLTGPLGDDAEVRLIGADGRLVRTVILPTGQVTLVLDLSGLAPALYVVELRGAGTVAQVRLVVQ